MHGPHPHADGLGRAHVDEQILEYGAVGRLDTEPRRGQQVHVRPVLADIVRIVDIWEGCRSRFVDAGPFLFGRFTIADAMFAPVVWRFLTYEVELPAASRKWVDAMLALPAMQEWRAAAAVETESVAATEALRSPR